MTVQESELSQRAHGGAQNPPFQWMGGAHLQMHVVHHPATMSSLV